MGQPIEGELPLNNTFAQIKQFENVYLQPDERVEIELDEYFRGNFLSFNAHLYLQNGNSSSSLYDPFLVRIQSPVQELIREDFPQTSTQMSLPQTSLIHTDSTDSKKYLIFIDFSMVLYIYDISLYFLYEDMSDLQTQRVPQISVTDLSSMQYINSVSKTCTNLIALEAELLMMNCLGVDPMRQAISVVIDISDLTKVKANYIPLSSRFDSLRDGTYSLLKILQDQYVLIVKENRTACYFDVQMFDGVNPPNTVRRVSFFQEPPLTEEQQAMYVNTQIPDISTCDQQTPSVDYVDEISLSIPYLQIQDLDVVPFYDGVVVASDYNYGLLFLSINCTNVSYCSYEPIAVIKEKGLSEIKILEESVLIQEKVIFVQRVNPPQVLEIRYDTRSKAQIRRVFTIMGDEGNYVSLSIIDANQDFVLTHLMSTKLMKPVYRIYKRTDSFFSIGHIEISYADFYDQGAFLSFISVRDNYLLLKTSDYFKILKVCSQKLEINATNYALIQKKGYLDQTLNVRLTASDVSYNQIQTNIQFSILSQSQGNRTLRKYDGQDSVFKSQPVYFYNCGEKQLKISIDSLFAGNRVNSLEMIDMNEGDRQGLFALSEYSFEQIDVKYIRVSGCSLKAIVENESAINQTKMLQCTSYNSNSLFFIDLLSSNNAIPRIIQNMTIEQANFLEYSYDEVFKELFLLSNRTSSGSTGAVVHFLRFYNLLSWEGSLDLNRAYPQLNNSFTFRYFNAMTQQSQAHMGTIVSDEFLDNNGNMVTTYLIFDQNQNPQIVDITIRAISQISIPIQTPPVSLQITRMDRFGNVWMALSNLTLNLYNMLPKQDQSDGLSDQLYLKKSFYFDNDPYLQGEVLINFITFAGSYKQDRQILFFGKNKMLLSNYVRGSAEIDRLIYLPLYYYDTDVDLETGVTYQYVINGFSNDIVYLKHGRNLLFVLFKRTHLSTTIGYSIFIYDITKEKQGSLLFKQHLDNTIQLVDTHARIELMPIDDTTIQIYLFIDETDMAIFQLKYAKELVLTEFDRERLMRQCAAQEEFNLTYYIQPEGDPTQFVSLVVRVENTGLVITAEEPAIDAITVSKESVQQETTILRATNGFDRRGNQSRTQVLDSLQTYDEKAQYSLLRMFRGQNMSYQIQCNSSENQTIEDCSHIGQVKALTKSFEEEIEVLGSSVSLLGFFVVEPVLLFFERTYLHIYLPEGDVHVPPIDLRDTNFNESLPVRYFLNTLTDSHGQLTHFLIYQDNDQRFGIALIYSALTFNITSISDYQDNFLVVKDILYLQKAQALMQVPWKIVHTQVYDLDQDKVDDNDVSINVRAILALNDPEILYNSLIRIYDIKYETPESLPQYQLSTARLLSVNRLNLDSFIVNSMVLVKNTTLLAIGIQNYGVILYDIIDYRIVKLISLVDQYQSTIGGGFFVNGIVPQPGEFYLHVILNTNAVYTVGLDIEHDFNSISITNIYLDDSVQNSSTRDVAVGSLGYAFIQDNYQQQTSLGGLIDTPILKFFSYFSSANSKSIGEIRLEFGEQCRYLQSLPLLFTQKNFIPSLSSDSFVTAAICGSTMKIKTFDYYPDLVLNVSQGADQVAYHRQIQIKSENAYVAQGNLQAEIFLDINILNQERSIQPSLYMLYFLLPLLLFFLMVISQKGKVDEPELPSEKKTLSKLQRTDENSGGESRYSETSTITSFFDSSSIDVASRSSTSNGDSFMSERIMNRYQQR